MSSVSRPVNVLVILLVLAASGIGVGINRALVAGSAAAAGPNVDWPSFGNTSDNTRFSPLAQINASNVGRLGYAWTMPEGMNLNGWESDPVVVNGTMYITTQTDQVIAIDAATGRVKWKFTPAVNFFLAIAGGGGGVPTNRGVVIANGKVYLLTFDDKLIVLQASTGEKLWQAQVADPHYGYSESSPGAYWNGMFFVGSAESDAGLRGFVAAYSATTGRQIWRFYTVPPVGVGWMPKRGDHGGGDVWMPPTVDTTTGILYFGTGNPSPDLEPNLRPGCDPWVDATVALDARSGRFLWGRTQVCPDAWDYDSHQPTSLFYVHKNGQTIRAVGQGNKSGYYWVFNARTGATISKSQPVVQESRPRPYPNARGVKVCPGVSGGMEYSPAAYSPLTQAVYEQGINVCMIETTESLADLRAHKRGTLDIGGSFLPVPPFSGTMSGINTATGRFLWHERMPKPMVGGVLATAGNLVFAGSDDGNLYGFNARSGRVQWKGHVGLPFGAAPISYMVNGVQYIAVATGGPGTAAFQNIPTGGTLAVFKLNGKPIRPLTVTQPPVGVTRAQIGSLLKGTRPLNQWISVNTQQEHVVLKIVANLTTRNSGLNFNGYTKGEANFIVPRGWSVDILFSNRSKIPHSLAFASDHSAHPKLPVIGIFPVTSPKPIAGIGPGVTVHLGFPAAPAGNYYMVCLVPGHLVGGMWDRFTISPTARMPSIQVGKAG